MDEAAGDAADEEVVGDEELDRVVKVLLLGLQHLVELLGLRNGTGEAVKDEPGRSSSALALQHEGGRRNAPERALLVLVELLLNHADHDLVADESSLVHDLLRLLAEVGALLHLDRKSVV